MAVLLHNHNPFSRDTRFQRQHGCCWLPVTYFAPSHQSLSCWYMAVYITSGLAWINICKLFQVFGDVNSVITPLPRDVTYELKNYNTDTLYLYEFAFLENSWIIFNRQWQKPLFIFSFGKFKRLLLPVGHHKYYFTCINSTEEKNK